MSDILEELSALRREDALEAEEACPFEMVLKEAQEAPLEPSFADAFKGPGMHVIAELKKASPSEGLIRGDFKPGALAAELEQAGAAALSVLCEPHRFLGGEAYLREARSRVKLPLLYKDFITTPYQVACARRAGASAVLLIAAVLEDAQLAILLDFAQSLGLEALVETHDATEIDRAVALGAQVIGVNCRDLRTFKTDPGITAQLIGRIPADRVRIAESGLHTADDLLRVQEAGANGFLIGTALMRAEHPGLKLKELISKGKMQ